VASEVVSFDKLDGVECSLEWLISYRSLARVVSEAYC
jgi:hypothetical protein